MKKFFLMSIIILSGAFTSAIVLQEKQSTIKKRYTGKFRVGDDVMCNQHNFLMTIEEITSDGNYHCNYLDKSLTYRVGIFKDNDLTQVSLLGEYYQETWNNGRMVPGRSM
jgi:uncharacterized protein YodC (DUF2158 family)